MALSAGVVALAVTMMVILNNRCLPGFNACMLDSNKADETAGNATTSSTSDGNNIYNHKNPSGCATSIPMDDRRTEVNGSGKESAFLDGADHISIPGCCSAGGGRNNDDDSNATATTPNDPLHCCAISRQHTCVASTYATTLFTRSLHSHAIAK